MRAETRDGAAALSNILSQELDSNDVAQARGIYEGQLYKYTNVVKGYQYRFFVLNRELGTLEYYMLEDIKKTRPRGAMHLAGAVISPSEEDGQMFTISAACGEIYRLRAQDSKKRQLWVNRMRSVAEAHTDSIGLKHPPLPVVGAGGGIGVKDKENSRPQPPGVLPCPGEAFQSLQQKLAEANTAFRDLAIAIETLPNAMQIKPHDQDLLLLKATSTATVVSLEQCFSLLAEQRHGHRTAQQGTPGHGSRKNHGHKQHSKKLKKKLRDWAHQPFRPVVQQSTSAGECKATISSAHSSAALPHVTSESTLVSMQTARSSGGEISDEEVGSPFDGQGPAQVHQGPIRETDIFPSTEDKDAILTLLGQLKLGTDLTRVSLPVFVQEPRSLLELYADLFSYAPLFVAISDGKTDEDRMLACIRWLLSALFATRRGLVARKPFNPVLGESFRCSFRLPRSVEDNGNPPPRVTFVAEQVSHHPPKSAIYVECIERDMKCEASLTVKASFMNMFVGIEFLGSLGVELININERYVVTLPQMACRSLVSRPYFEFSGKMRVRCSKTGCSATISFPSKQLVVGPEKITSSTSELPTAPDPPFHGAKMHGVTVEMRNRENNICLRGQGHWNESVSFSREAGDLQHHFEFNIRSKEQCCKRVRPLAEQDANESRRVWAHVSRALQQGDFEAASGYKFQLEETYRKMNQGGDQNKDKVSGGSRHDRHMASSRAFEPKLFRLVRRMESNSSLCDYEYKHALQQQQQPPIQQQQSSPQ
ncbi:oxysterol-binding protein-related protein 11-like isoform X8 [Varroa destructor]|uniref:Oxysterol-binding protein n=1 Tax=Varroa destructor TaxID=109461 RepID=A0A7M7J3W4_VARDE|nr:oxysterol-binding protein-related protein 11-like isoform X8 [Varroa destructor]